MHKINLFVEDRGHAIFLQALVHRLANHYGISVFIRLGSARGGYGKMVSKLKEYISDLQLDQEDLPDLLIVATDGNCKGYMGRKQEIDGAVKGFNGRVIYAIPDPHIERWLLLDSSAFKKVLGRGCSAPIQKCERTLYKRLLLEAVRKTGVNPPLGGIEYTEDSLGKLLKALREIFREWERSEQSML